MNRQLTRSRDAMIGGVAAGVANWINADPALVRIAWAILVPITAGAALLAYIVAWIVVPEEPRHPDTSVEGPVDTEGGTSASVHSDSNREDGGRTARFIGGGLVLLGLWFLVRESLPSINWSLVWPLVLVGIGLAIVVNSMRRR